MCEVEYVLALHCLAEAEELLSRTILQSMVLQLNDDNHALKHSEDEENEWHNLEPLGLWLVDCTTCNSAVRVCGVDSVNHLLDHQLTRLEVWDDDEGKNK
jgi:hypothetical protein